ncbi:MurR/RpiR family transcriptional regulator [Ligilactobacillus agilis]|uniref:MurR/RpiR family transcriptional regulator n=1 Tax=Ligilactobacillus agilis TaxID=1601 RepID=UPI00265CC46A|nr:MurR/RpiR family transcriptional regulator [Ligilactobacillus agilis]
MNFNTDIIDKINSHLPSMSESDQKIANVILNNPQAIVNYTITELANKAAVSTASVSRFCKNLDLVGFHQLKILLAQTDSKRDDYFKEVSLDDFSASLNKISANKVAEIRHTLLPLDSKKILPILELIKKARLIQISAEGATFPVAEDAAYKFNQIGFLAIATSSYETALAQTINLSEADLLIAISNSGESRELLSQITIAHQKHVPVLALTNRQDSPIALEADFHIKTAVRQRVLESQYYFSRLAALSVIEVLFLLLIADDPKRLAKIEFHEQLVAQKKI